MDERIKQRAALHHLQQVLEVPSGAVLRGSGGLFGEQATELLDRQIAVAEVGAAVVNGFELKDQAEGSRQGGLQRGPVARGRAAGGFAGAGGRPADALKQDPRLGVQMLLQRGKVIRFADVGYPRQPDGRSRATGGEEFAHGDLELDEVGVHIGDAHVGFGRRRYAGGAPSGRLPGGASGQQQRECD